MKRKCTACKDEFDIEQFPWKNEAKGIRHSICFACRREVSKNDYLKNKQAYIDRAAKHKESEKAKTEALLLEFRIDGCVICGDTRIEALDFHHLNPAEKEHNVTKIGRKKMLEEIKKCVVLCASCHRVEHHLQRQGKTQL